MTLREALYRANLDKVYVLIHEHDQRTNGEYSCSSLNKIIYNYKRVVKELLEKPKIKPYSMPILIKSRKDLYSSNSYIDVCLLNTRYVKPPKGAQPWGGKRGVKVPKGKYNCNAKKYNQYFSLAGVPWSKLIDTEIQIKSKCTLEKALAHLLWELTFDGWTEKQVEKNSALIMKYIKEVELEIERGQYNIISPKKKKNFKMIIPKSISKQIKKFLKEQKS
jgi:hypothetical protein